MRSFRTGGGLAAFLMVIALAACGDGDTPLGIPDAAAGTYTLRTVDGDSLPAVEFEDSDYRAEVLSASILLRTDGQCTYLGRYRETFKVSNTVEEGDYTSGCTAQLAGTDLTLTFADRALGGTLVGGTMTVNAEGQVWVFTR